MKEYKFYPSEAAEAWIRDLFDKNGKGCSAVLGISGGIIMTKDKEYLCNEWLAEEDCAKIYGWDFSHIEGRYKEYPLPWDYKTVIHKYLGTTDRLLDIDTGGGEFLMTLGHPQNLTYATEGYSPNVELCRRVFSETEITFAEMSDYKRMPFPDETFDIVINRHGTYVAEEIYRVLKKGGLFITQQVGEDNDRELVEMLHPDCKKQFCGHNLGCQAKLFENNGFEILEGDEAFVPIEFYDVGALVWFAKIIEWEFVGFSVEKSFKTLQKAEKTLTEKGKISGKAHRFYLVARK